MSIKNGVIPTNVLISIKPRYVESILKGGKTVEIRRGRIGLEIGTVLWIYATLPKGRVELQARVDGVDCGTHSAIWRKYGKYTGITKSEFCDYVEGSDKATAIKLVSVRKVKPAPKLEVLRAAKMGFQPPQSYVRLSTDNPLLERLIQLEQRKSCG